MTARREMLAACLALALAAVAAPARAEEPIEISCTTSCHGQETTALGESIHASVLSCTDCHGGDPAAFRDQAAAHSLDAGFRGSPAREAIPELCGSCHGDPVRMHAYALRADQLIQYRSSVHGRALYEDGNTSVAVCSDCHGAHRILPGADPRAPTAKSNQPETCGRCHADEALMQASGLTADTVDRYLTSAHGRALLGEDVRGAPSCADCHGSHGAAPPGVGHVVDVCGRCHVNEKEYYLESAHFRSEDMGCAICHEDEKGYVFQRTGCATCHGSHAVEPPGPHLYEGDAPGHCGHCHRQGDEASAFAAVVADGRNRLIQGLEETQQVIEDGKAKGLWFEHEAVYERESERTLVAVRTLTHALDAEAVAKYYADGLAQQEGTREEVAKRASALRDRKIILSVLVLLLLLLTGLLALKLRAIRRLS